MTQSSHPPEVVQAFKLLKDGDRTAAGRVLRDYLAANPRDTDAWWLMAHVVGKPENAVKILQKILVLDPEHEKARAKLAQLTGETEVAAPDPAPAQPPAAAASDPAPDPFAPPDPAPDPFATQAPADAPANDADKVATYDRWEPAGGTDSSAPDASGDERAGWSADAAVADLAGDFQVDAAGDEWLTGAIPGDTAESAPATESLLDEEPDDDLFFGTVSPKRASKRRTSPRRASTLPVLKPADVPPTGETGPVTVPLPERSRPADPTPAVGAAASADDPFAFEPTESMIADVGEPDWLSAAGSPAPAARQAAPVSTVTFEHYAANTIVQIDPFSGAPANDPFVDLEQLEAEFAESGGGAVLPLVGYESVDEDDEEYGRRTLTDQMIAIAVAGFTVLVLLSTILFAIDNAGAINVFPDLGYGWDTLDAGTFAIDYPDSWNKVCAREPSNYVVCGIANHALYNEVEDYVGYDVDLGAQSDAYYDAALSGTLPSESISVIVMDVPVSSPAYDNGSLAKTRYELNQYYNFYDNVWYSGSVEETIDGYTAYTYKFTGEGWYGWKVAAWDVYIPHDGIMLWLRVSFNGDTIPERTIEKMIDSIDIHPGE